MRRVLFLGSILFSLTFSARASLVLDQQQTVVQLGTAGDGFLIGGEQQYQLAQTVTTGVTGRLARIDLPVVCDSGALIVEIRDVAADDVPGTTVLSTTAVDASALPPGGGFVFHEIDLATAVHFNSGDRFAIVLRNDSGQCHNGMGDADDLYPGGRSVWRYAGTAPGFWLSTGGFLDPVDTSFKTWVDVTAAHSGGGEPACSVSGFAQPLPFPAFVPLCRCLQDPGLRETRCGFFHPRFFLFREIPDPIRPGDSFTVRWTLLPLGDIDGAVELTDALPDGFEGSKGPLTFYPGQVPAGQSITLSYQAKAGARAGRFKAETHIALPTEEGKPDLGTMRTSLEVERK